MVAAIMIAAAGGLARAEVDQPQAVIDRPRTLPAGEGEALASLVYTRPSADPAIADRLALELGAGYGVTRAVDVAVMYPLALRPSLSGDTSASADVGVTFLRGRVSAAARVRGGWVHGAAPVAPFELGVEAQWRVSAHVALFTDARQLSIGVSGERKPITLALPVGVAVQAAPSVYVQLATRACSLGLRNHDTKLFGRDGEPVSLRVFVSPTNALDLFAGAALLSADRPRDRFAFALGARLFF
jgi:hypothetical protein